MAQNDCGVAEEQRRARVWRGESCKYNGVNVKQREANTIPALLMLSTLRLQYMDMSAAPSDP